MRHISVLHKKHAPIHLGRVKVASHKIIKGSGGLVSYGKRLSPSQYAEKVDASERLGSVVGGGLRHKHLKPLKFKF